jgi:hypothetical protein
LYKIESLGTCEYKVESLGTCEYKIASGLGLENKADFSTVDFVSEGSGRVVGVLKRESSGSVTAIR